MTSITTQDVDFENELSMEHPPLRIFSGILLNDAIQVSDSLSICRQFYENLDEVIISDDTFEFIEPVWTFKRWAFRTKALFSNPGPQIESGSMIVVANYTDILTQKGHFFEKIDLDLFKVTNLEGEELDIQVLEGPDFDPVTNAIVETRWIDTIESGSAELWFVYFDTVEGGHTTSPERIEVPTGSAVYSTVHRSEVGPKVLRFMDANGDTIAGYDFGELDDGLASEQSFALTNTGSEELIKVKLHIADNKQDIIKDDWVSMRTGSDWKTSPFNIGTVVTGSVVDFDTKIEVPDGKFGKRNFKFLVRYA